MSSLTERFPETVEVEGRKLPVNSDFRTALFLEEVIAHSGDVINEEDLVKMLGAFYIIRELYTEEHVNKMFWFLSCGREKQRKRFPKKAAGINDEQPFDFEKDADLIYAGFMQQYHIDLQESNMHWWKFMILLENLGSETRLSRVMEYRTIDTKNRRLSKEERSFYSALQNYYKIRKEVILNDKEKAIEEALLNGGDVSSLLGGDKN